MRLVVVAGHDEKNCRRARSNLYRSQWDMKTTLSVSKENIGQLQKSWRIHQVSCHSIRCFSPLSTLPSITTGFKKKPCNNYDVRLDSQILMLVSDWWRSYQNMRFPVMRRKRIGMCRGRFGEFRAEWVDAFSGPLLGIGSAVSAVDVAQIFLVDNTCK